jgi:ubiquitin-protein ligase
VVHATLHKLLKTPKKDSVIAWMAAVVSLNEARDAPHFRGKKREKTYANNSVMVNFCNVMLKFCQPFFSTCRSPKLAKINHLYYTLPSCRLDMHNEPCMAMGCLQALDGRQKDYRRFLVENSSNFLTECFFLTQRALHVGLMTTITHFERTIGDMLKAREAEIAIPGQSWDNRILLHVVSWGTSLFDPRFVQLCSEFYITQSAWLMMKMEECKKPGMSETEVMTEQQRVFAHIPEYCVKDMAQWFRFLVRHRSDVLQSLPIDIGVFVTCCVTLLQRPDLLPSALSQSRIVRMLLSFVDNSSRDKRGTGLLGPSGWGSGAFDLSSVVHTCPSVQESLGPALLHTYAAVDVIEGLDVDKEEFDKYGSRFEITCLIENLWRRQDCKASILAESSTEKFKSFLSAILDTLLYQMNDSLARLANVKQVQQAQEDEKAWKSLSYGERERKLKFLRGEESVAQSFMKMAISTLGLLDLVSQSDEVCQCFSTPPLSIRAAAAITNFLDALCGSRSIDLKVKDMSKYNFDPKKLLLTITTVMLRLAKQSPAEAPYVSPSYQDFVQAMADHPDYSHSTMNKASSILRRLGSDEHYAEFIKLVDRVNSILSIINKSEGTATAAALDTSWQDEVEAVDIGIEDLKIVYSAALEDSKYDSYSLQECHAFESHLAVQSLDPRSLKLRALMREATQLSDHLPIHQESSIFVRQDEDRMDIIRALITGPVGTPYSLGCFVFDIYFPTNYPSVPPLVKLITTGNGTVRFNPNLYADGKVCLSLLGTWHGGDATEKWDPNKSNVLQVLLSIQGMILIPDPMYNEPGYEGMRDTPEGNERSAQYNAGIRLSTVRYAMVDQLRKPVEGFDDIIKVHFSLVRDAVLLQCSKWLRECKSPEQERRLRKAVDDLRRELDKL